MLEAVKYLQWACNWQLNQGRQGMLILSYLMSSLESLSGFLSRSSKQLDKVIKAKKHSGYYLPEFSRLLENLLREICCLLTLLEPQQETL